MGGRKLIGISEKLESKIDGRERESATNPASAGSSQTSQCHIQRHHTSDSLAVKASMPQAAVNAFTIPYRRDHHHEQPCRRCRRAKHDTTQSLFFAPQTESFKPPPRVLPSSRNTISSEQLHIRRDAEAIQCPHHLAQIMFSPWQFL
ncbi:hypothetical protein LR48_Vigan09g115400 [Vigna angularis]|uniref:Uncharacterized protein n=1 Tax=Phaseolus angularis TaxID=3914 RepID=A0A0L9VBR2_PHAAN|nr:hypothetical protein LR48_Vigan09g115400 [Vigna angularis]